MAVGLTLPLDAEPLDGNECEESCLSSPECVAPLIAAAPPGCLYCLAEELLGEDDGWD